MNLLITVYVFVSHCHKHRGKAILNSPHVVIYQIVREQKKEHNRIEH